MKLTRTHRPVEKSEIENLAEQVLDALDIVALPVDPLNVARQEAVSYTHLRAHET